MGVELMITLFLIGFIGSFVSGLVGIGGSIIKYPMLLYIPPALGLAAYTSHEVSGISAVQVFFATLSGVWALRKDNLISRPLVGYMGGAIVLGSLAGGYGGKYLSGETVNLVYGVLASIAAVMMFMPNKMQKETASEEIRFNRPLSAIAALLVGVASGIVGAAGAFILVPIMLLILKIPTRVTIASSLAITLISSIGTTVGKVMVGDVLLGPSVVMVIASMMAAPLGTMVSKRTSTKALQINLALLIFGTAVKIWWDYFALV